MGAPACPMTTVADQRSLKPNLQSLLLANRCMVPLSDDERAEVQRRFNLQDLDMVSRDRDHPMWGKLYYGEQPKRAREQLAKLAKDFPVQAAIFAPAVELMLEDLAKADAERAERKLAMQARRDGRVARAAQRDELGVDLKTKGGCYATPATYKAMRAGLKPIENALAAWLKELYTADYNALLSKLTAADWDTIVAFPCHDRRGVLLPGRADLPMEFSKFFVRNGITASPAPGVEPAAVIARDAARDADEAVAGFAAKLAGKVDGSLKELSNGVLSGNVDSVSVAGNMWDNSVVTVRTNYGEQVWHTKVIWNRSVYGKSFNQWPTRRMS